jgi:hypothetical protein
MARDDLYYFEGFSDPNFTQVPNELFDELAPQLTEAELRVLLYIVRRTFGFGKKDDAISVNQMANGITASDGRVLDYGTGMSRSAVWRGAKGLVSKGILAVDHVQSTDGEYATNIYRLRFREGVSLEKRHPISPKEQPVSLQESTQKKVDQNKAQQEIEIDKSISPRRTFGDADRKLIQPFIADLARELNDQAKLSASTTRAVKLFRASRLDHDSFLDAMQEARRRTQEHSANIRNTDSKGVWPRKQKFAYFLAVLQNIVLPSEGKYSAVAD